MGRNNRAPHCAFMTEEDQLRFVKANQQNETQNILTKIINLIENTLMKALVSEYRHRDRLAQLRNRNISPQLSTKILEGIMVEIREGIHHLRQLSQQQQAADSDQHLWRDIDNLEKSIIRARQQKFELSCQMQQLQEEVMSQECVIDMKRDFLQKVEAATRKHHFLLSRGVLSGSTLSSSTPRHFRQSVKSIVLP